MYERMTKKKLRHERRGCAPEAVAFTTHTHTLMFKSDRDHDDCCLRVISSIQDIYFTTFIHVLQCVCVDMSNR